MADEKNLQDELLSDEQLENVSGGNLSETIKDREKLTQLGMYKFDLNKGFVKSVNEGIAKLGKAVGCDLNSTLKIKGSNDENKKHITRLNHSISFNTIFRECGIPAETKDQRQTIRRNVSKILDFFKEQGFIKNYVISPNPDGNFSIEIFF
jgi:hypothetical protein